MVDYSIAELPEPELVRATAQIIADGKILGWFQGRAEWGPRALGNRSIVADPRRPEMKEILNRRIKHREIFPSVRAIHPRGIHRRVFRKISPIAVHDVGVFGASREDGTKFRRPRTSTGPGGCKQSRAKPIHVIGNLIKAFESLTGVPVVLNTSFNDNEPIVCRPEEAIDCFLRTQMDALVLGDFLIVRESLS